MEEPINADETDALCPECGHAFKTFVDRLVGPDGARASAEPVPCPVCGCGSCNLEKPS